MGFLGKVVGGLVRTVAPKIIQAVAPAATKLLQGVVGDAFKAGGAVLKNLAGRLPSPLQGLAQKLLGNALPKLQNLAQGGIEKFIAKLAESITSRFAPGAGNVNTPGVGTPERQAAINNPANQPATGSSSSAATGGAAPSSPAAPTGGSSSTSGAGMTSGAPSSPPNPSAYGDLEKRENMERLLRDQQKYQTAFQAMQNYWTMMSNIMKSNFDALKQINGNIR